MINLGFVEIDGIVFFTVAFALACALLEIAVSFLARRFIGRISPIILLFLGAGMMFTASFVFTDWDAVGYFLLGTYLTVLGTVCVLICAVCSIIRRCIKA